MRFHHPDGTLVHLSYCSNVHPAETVDGLVDQLERYAAEVRRTLGVPVLGVGLWLPATAAVELDEDLARLAGFRATLERLGLEVVSLNAFPYGGFHDPVVKGAVYHPDWAQRSRLDYTLRCARVLAALLPDDVAVGSISTVPLAWRTPWTDARRVAVRAVLDDLAAGLAEVEHRTGRRIRVGFEPEPGCVVETSAQAVEELAGLHPERLGLCLDTCHLATGFEDAETVLARWSAAGLDVVKTQASAALEVPDPRDPAARAALAGWAEDRFLHQTRERCAEGVVARDDLPEALAGDDPLPGDDAWRVHFHVPLHTAPAAPLRATQDDLVAALRVLLAGPVARTAQVEVETYTWGVLPLEARPRDDADLVAGIAAELAWTREVLLGLGLEAAAGSRVGSLA